MARLLSILLAFALHWGGVALAEELRLVLPPLKTSITFGGQAVAIIASGVITGHPNSLQNSFRLTVTADMSDLQDHMTALLKDQLETQERCGDRLSVANATLVPASPAGSLTANLHYERWVCVKVLGKEVNKKLLGGDGMVPVNLSPSIEGAEVKLLAEVGTIAARGALGKVLRSPPVRDRLRDRIGASVQSALQGGTNLQTLLPPAIEKAASIVGARFTDAGSGRLAFELAADIRLSAAEIRKSIGR